MADPVTPAAPAEPPVAPPEVAPPQAEGKPPTSPPAPAPRGAPPARKTFEEWAKVKGLAPTIDARTGRASSIVQRQIVNPQTKQPAKGTRPVRSGRSSSPALVNAARAKGNIPIGRLMTEAEFDAAINAAKNIVLGRPKPEAEKVRHASR